jgi:hypothetical protein
VRTIIEQAPRFLNPAARSSSKSATTAARVELAFPKLPFVWLETATSSDGVFLIKREALVAGR